MSAFLVIWWAFWIFMMLRTRFVYNFRVRLLKEEGAYVRRDILRWCGTFRRMDSIPDYFTMLYKFWVPLKRWELPIDVYHPEIRADMTENSHDRPS